MSESASSSSSYSAPVTPPADLITQGILDNISGVALQYANQIYNWGQGVFNNLQSFTNQNVAQLTAAADTAMGGANSSMQQYTNSFLPDYQGLRTTAADYANPARQARNAGMAESDQQQAGDRARLNAEQNLQSMGIDPSSGRYADLENASRTASAAAAAGAGTQSIRADESTALGLKKEALDYGIQLPGIAANFLNQANQARSISQNAQMGTANTGANLMQLPNAYLSTAMSNKYPPSGQASSSQSQQRSQTAPGSGGGGSPGSPGSGGSGVPFQGAGGGPGYNGGVQGNTSGYLGGHQPNAAIQQVNSGDQFDNSPVNGTSFDSFSQDNNTAFGGQSDPFAADYGGYNTGGNDFNPGATNTGGVYDPSASYNSFDSGQGFGSTEGDNSGYSPGGFDNTQSAPQDNSGFNDYGSTSLGLADQSTGTQDMSSFGSGDEGFAKGGAIPDPSATTGGQVPLSASPSGGQQPDDVHASVTPDEFVIPRDVALWKGQEFFQKLIAQSRKNLATAPARGKPAAPPTGPVNFASQPIGQR